MLTDRQVESLRAAVQAAQSRARVAPWRWAKCIDGPLVGIQVRLELAIYRGPEASFGWCFLTREGPVVAHYQQGGRPGEWRFAGWCCPGRKESGRMLA
jgi:hypothetical protein